MKKSLFGLLLGGLGLGMTEFVMMGLLPVMAKTFHTSIPLAGYLISLYALGVVLGAPTLVLMVSRFSLKNILLLLMGLFTLFNGLAALAPNFTSLLFCRFLAGLPHGAFFGTGTLVANQLAEKGKESRAVAIMFSGLAIANLVGVPLATYMGFHWGWRYPFMLIASIGLLTLITLFSWLPQLKKAEPIAIKKQLGFFKRLDAWLIMIIICIGTGGFFSWYSYIAPLLIQISHFGSNSVAYVLIVAGFGMLLGNLLGGYLSDHYSPLKAIAILIISMIIVLLFTHFFAMYKPIELIMTFLTGASAFALIAPIQMFMVRAFAGSELLASAISQACFNIGNALGAFLGGLPIVYGLPYNDPVLVGAAMALFSLIFVAWLYQHMSKITYHKVNF